MGFFNFSQRLFCNVFVFSQTSAFLYSRSRKKGQRFTCLQNFIKLSLGFLVLRSKELTDICLQSQSISWIRIAWISLKRHALQMHIIIDRNACLFNIFET